MSRPLALALVRVRVRAPATYGIAIALALALALALATFGIVRLYELHTAWSVTLAILGAGGACIALALALRHAPRSSPRRARGALPADPGIPKPPLGAPYRGI